jgi:DUF4097 and DUF4098 domain-containing protein YvlB
VPAGLLTFTVQAAMQVACGATAAAATSARVAAITEGVLKAMFLTKLKTMTTFLVVFGAPALGVGVFGSPAPPHEPAPVLAARDEDPLPDDDPPRDRKKTKKETKSGNFANEGQRAKAEETISKSFKTKAVPNLVVETFNGPISVTTGREGTVQVKVVKTIHADSEEAAKDDLKNVDVSLTQEDNAIRITAKTEGHHLQTQRAAAVVLQAPPGARLELRTSNGAVTASGPVGDVAVHTSNGKIEVGSTKGKVNLITSNGPISVDEGTGPFDLTTSNGRIDIKAAKAVVKARTANGGIEFHGNLGAGSHSFHTTNGSISLTLPSDAQFRVDAVTSHGQVTSSFPVKGADRRPKTQLQATVGDDPSINIKMATTNGNIEIKSEKE